MKGGKLFVFAGIGLALIAVALLVVNMGGGGEADAVKSAQDTKVTVVQAGADIPAHQVLTLTDLIEVEVNASEAPADSVNTIAEVIGQSYRSSLVVGQPLLKSQVEAPGLRNVIEPGKRAIGVPIDNVSGFSGLIQDGDYIDIVFHARIDLVRRLSTTVAWIPEDASYTIKNPPIVGPQDIPDELWPIAGDDGSVFRIRDAGGETEPVAKIILQDIEVLRVVRPGETYLGNGTLAAEVVSTGVTAPGDTFSQLVLEVTPAQAEAITFMQDINHQYQVVIRGKDDHEAVATNGVTFQILATDPTWSLPWPKSIEAPAPEDQENAR
jgi:Flp pilus assembly protein CpaB